MSLIRVGPAIAQYADQGKIIAEFYQSQQQQISKIPKNTGSSMMDYIMNWMVTIQSVEYVDNILSNKPLFDLISDKKLQDYFSLAIQEDNLELFKAFAENSNSLARIKKNSKTIWNAIFNRVLDYDMTLVQTNPRKSRLMTYILSSSEIMETMDSNIVSSIFYSSFSDYSMLETLLNNDVAMKKVNMAKFGARFNALFRHNGLNDGVTRLCISRPEIRSHLTPAMIGKIFVTSSQKNWMDTFELILDTDELFTGMDIELLNTGITINIDDHIEIIGSKLISSPLLLGKLTHLSLGKLFTRILALQQSVVNSFLENEYLITLVPPNALAAGIDSLIVENTGSKTTELLSLFLDDKYVARISDENWETIVKHSIRYNREQILALLFQHDSILRRMSTVFLKRAAKYLNDDQKAKIRSILQERPKGNVLAPVQRGIEKFKDRRVRPISSFTRASFPVISQEEIMQNFQEMKDLAKKATKDGHVLTLGEQSAIVNEVISHNVPHLPKK